MTAGVNSTRGDDSGTSGCQGAQTGPARDTKIRKFKVLLVSPSPGRKGGARERTDFQCWFGQVKLRAGLGCFSADSVSCWAQETPPKAVPEAEVFFREEEEVCPEKP